MLSIRDTTVHEVESSLNIDDLLGEYGRESAILGLPKPCADMAMYKQMEASGMYRVIGAFLDEKLIGFVAILSPILPHYSQRIAVSESFFVLKAHRYSGAGLKLLKAAEDHAKKIGCVGLLMSTPTGGILSKVLPKVGYRETNSVFFRNLNDE